MTRIVRILTLLLVGMLCAGAACARDTLSDVSRATIAADALPPEAQTTLATIERGGPFRYERDGIAFGNRERLLPERPRGYYREYTVPTPGVTNRGARRIVAGRSGEYYYSDDHYKSFHRISR